MDARGKFGEHERTVKADLHDATLTHATSLPRAYNMTWDLLHAHDFFQLQN